MKHDPLRAQMARGWGSGRPFTECGAGSPPEHTRGARLALPVWCAHYKLRVVADAGAGDMAWRRDMVWDVEYHPFDLVPREQAVRQWDITREALPEADLIVCRMVLNHLSEGRVRAALALFRQSGRYLAATQFDHDRGKKLRDFTRYDLRPWLGEPLERVQDGLETGCDLALWRLA